MADDVQAIYTGPSPTGEGSVVVTVWTDGSAEIAWRASDHESFGPPVQLTTERETTDN